MILDSNGENKIYIYDYFCAIRLKDVFYFFKTPRSECLGKIYASDIDPDIIVVLDRHCGVLVDVSIGQHEVYSKLKNYTGLMPYFYPYGTFFNEYSQLGNRINTIGGYIFIRSSYEDDFSVCKPYSLIDRDDLLALLCYQSMQHNDDVEINTVNELLNYFVRDINGLS
ncbi:hypothetical protein EDL98_06765 [Ornithobacterium rhinotracheale]|uniref:hypothetical protein n=1 Tax=Ornithobacterium rhinotracheale TaxID=28251 RepID=UPI00129D0614|nr:hypothetical protein [Ornithobacterium rhinotracheale]MRJ10783.1 hypothetical protein [Ornithobacterium rhinotracheale]